VAVTGLGAQNAILSQSSPAFNKTETDRRTLHPSTMALCSDEECVYKHLRRIREGTTHSDLVTEDSFRGRDNKARFQSQAGLCQAGKTR
jgi:hypothetical protein